MTDATATTRTGAAAAPWTVAEANIEYAMVPKRSVLFPTHHHHHHHKNNGNDESDNASDSSSSSSSNSSSDEDNDAARWLAEVEEYARQQQQQQQRPQQQQFPQQRHRPAALEEELQRQTIVPEPYRSRRRGNIIEAATHYTGPCSILETPRQRPAERSTKQRRPRKADYNTATTAAAPIPPVVLSIDAATQVLEVARPVISDEWHSKRSRNETPSLQSLHAQRHSVLIGGREEESPIHNNNNNNNNNYHTGTRQTASAPLSKIHKARTTRAPSLQRSPTPWIRRRHESLSWSRHPHKNDLHNNTTNTNCDPTRHHVQPATTSPVTTTAAHASRSISLIKKQPPSPLPPHQCTVVVYHDVESPRERHGNDHKNNESDHETPEDDDNEDYSNYYYNNYSSGGAAAGAQPTTTIMAPATTTLVQTPVPPTTNTHPHPHSEAGYYEKYYHDVHRQPVSQPPPPSLPQRPPEKYQENDDADDDDDDDEDIYHCHHHQQHGYTKRARHLEHHQQTQQQQQQQEGEYSLYIQHGRNQHHQSMPLPSPPPPYHRPPLNGPLPAYYQPGFAPPPSPPPHQHGDPSSIPPNHHHHQHYQHHPSYSPGVAYPPDYYASYYRHHHYHQHHHHPPPPLRPPYNGGSHPISTGENASITAPFLSAPTQQPPHTPPARYEGYAYHPYPPHSHPSSYYNGTWTPPPQRHEQSNTPDSRYEDERRSSDREVDYYLHKRCERNQTDNDDNINDIIQPSLRKKEKMGKPKRKKDKTKPKRPLSAYNFFFKDERAKMLQALLEETKSKNANGETAAAAADGRALTIPFQEMARRVSVEWQVVDDQTKKEYQKLADLDTDRYHREVYEWRMKKRQQANEKLEEKGVNNDDDDVDHDKDNLEDDKPEDGDEENDDDEDADNQVRA